MNSARSFRAAHGRLNRVFFLCALTLAACSTPGPRTETQFRTFSVDKIDAAIESAIAEERTPGGVFHLESPDGIYRRAYGARSLKPHDEIARVNTIYDLASLTKVIATAPSVMILVERGVVRLNDPMGAYFRELRGRPSFTIRQAMTHTSGLAPGLSLRTDWEGIDEAVRIAAEMPRRAFPGQKFIYSDINYILLGELIRRTTGQRLDEFAEENIFKPLRMNDTSFNPSRFKRGRIAPTTWDDSKKIRGVVHDPTARRLDGVAGHAGVFSTAADIARFARMSLNGGILEGRRILSETAIFQMTQIQTPTNLEAKRGLGWDIDTGYSRLRGNLFSKSGYGHTGFTGPSLWIDTETQSFVLFLCNRVHPDGNGNVLDLRETLGTLGAKAVLDLKRFEKRPTALKRTTLNGIDRLAQEKFLTLQGKSIGLITNHTGHDRNRVSTIEWFLKANGIQLKALFSPEHGIEGLLDEKVADSEFKEANLPIYSLYGANKEPTAAQLEGVDTLVFDIQDIGTRFYTYISTMGLAMKAAESQDIEFVVLDRINPIRGDLVEGPRRIGKEAFVAFHDIPIRHGMTVGELARLLRAERFPDLRLNVVTLDGWSRGTWGDNTALPWTNPSPNMRSLTEAILYPGVGILEFADLSVGRGTDTPFELIGAPYIDGEELASALSKSKTPGVRFEPIVFIPNASKFANQRCEGVSIHLTDRDQFKALRTGVLLAKTLHDLYAPEFELSTCDTLLKHPPTLQAIRDGVPVDAIVESWRADEAAFLKRRQPFLIYSPRSANSID